MRANLNISNSFGKHYFLAIAAVSILLLLYVLYKKSYVSETSEPSMFAKNEVIKITVKETAYVNSHATVEVVPVRAPAAVIKTKADLNYFEKDDIRNQINSKYRLLEQNLRNLESWELYQGKRANQNFYEHGLEIPIRHKYTQQRSHLDGQKAVELCEKIKERCTIAQDYLEHIAQKK